MVLNLKHLKSQRQQKTQPISIKAEKMRELFRRCGLSKSDIDLQMKVQEIASADGGDCSVEIMRSLYRL